MELLVRNADGIFSARDREYAAKKLGQLDRFFSPAQKVELVHKEQKGRHRLEVTVFADGHFLRGEVQDQSVRAAIDRAAEKLDLRLRRLKNRLVRPNRGKAHSHEEAAPPQLNTGFEQTVVHMKPMSLGEAALQMEVQSRPFFLFLNEQSGKVELLYQKESGGLGILIPEHSA